MTVTVFALADDRARVVVGGKRHQSGNFLAGGGGQLVDFNERGKIAREFFKALEAALPITPEPSAPTYDSSRATTISELAELAALREKGLLTEEEFRAAKAQLLGFNNPPA